MSLNYSLEDARHGQSNEDIWQHLIDTGLAADEDAANQIVFGAGVACMVASYTLETPATIAETFARLELLARLDGTTPHISKEALLALEGITWNVSTVGRAEWLADVSRGSMERTLRTAADGYAKEFGVDGGRAPAGLPPMSDKRWNVTVQDAAGHALEGYAFEDADADRVHDAAKTAAANWDGEDEDSVYDVAYDAAARECVAISTRLGTRAGR